MTAQEGTQPRILIVDTDIDMAETVIEAYMAVKSSGRPQAPIPTFVDTVRASQSKLSDREYSYAALFISPTIGMPAWVAVVRCAHQYRPGIPVFVLHDRTLRLRRSDIEGLGIAGFVSKPLSYDRMLELIGSGEGEEAHDESILPEDGEQAPQAQQANSDDCGPTDSDVIEVDLSNLIGRVKSPFDLFIKLSNGKYVKVALAGDVLTAERLDSYKTRGARALFVLRSAQDAVLDFCDIMVAEVLNDDAVPAQIKTSQVLAQGESTLRLLRDAGFTERSIQRAQTFVANTTEMVKQIAGHNELVRRLLSDIAAIEHSVASATLCGLLIKHIGGANPAVFNGVGVACFLHDLALIGQPPVVRDEEPAKMTPEQLEIFRQHPAESARLVSAMPKVPPMVVTAIAQHHMRRDSSGFPSPGAGEEPTRLAELIGLSEEFIRLAEKARDDRSLNPVEALRAQAATAFSEPILDAFIRTFSEK